MQTAIPINVKYRVNEVNLTVYCAVLQHAVKTLQKQGGRLSETAREYKLLILVYDDRQLAY